MDFLSKFKIFDELPEAYIVREQMNGSNSQGYIGDPDYSSRLFALNDFISSRDDVILCLREDGLIALPIDKPPVEESFAVGISSSTPKGCFPLIHVNSGFTQVYDLSVSSGRGLQSADFLLESGDAVTPPEHPDR